MRRRRRSLKLENDLVATRDVRVGDLLVRYSDGTPAVVLEVAKDLARGHFQVRPSEDVPPRKQYRLWTEGSDVWIKEFSLNAQYYRACDP